LSESNEDGGLKQNSQHNENEPVQDSPEELEIIRPSSETQETVVWRPPRNLKKKRSVLRKILIVLIILALHVAGYVIYSTVRVKLRNYTKIDTPTGIIKVYHGRGMDIEDKFLHITLGDLNNVIAEFSQEAAENKFGRTFLDNARKQLADKGYTLATPGQKPDPEKALAIIESVLFAQAYVLDDALFDSDKDKKPEYATYKQLQNEGREHIPVEISSEPLYKGYKFEIKLGLTVDAREKSFSITALPVTGKGAFYYADQTGVVRLENNKPATGKSGMLKKIELE